MAIDPDVWHWIVGDLALPAPGQFIRWNKRREDQWRTGVVRLVWLCQDEPAITCADESVIFPRLGDRWEYVFPLAGAPERREPK